MKKLLCIVLAAALVLSLGVGALAYEDMDPPLWQRWGYDSLEEYLADWDETEEEYAAEVAEILAERAEQDALIATYDPETHDFTPALWEYYEYASKEEMMEAWEIDEAGYAAAVDDELFNYECRDWTDEQWEAYYAEQEAAEILAVKEARGLTNDLNVMADGAVVDFPASRPVIRGGYTMAPLTAVAAALNAEYSYDAATGAIKLRRGNTAMELTVGDMILSFRTEGPNSQASGGVFYLDSLPYAEGGEAFVPLRAVAEAFGYDVEWSDTYRTAVLLDVEKTAAEFDRKFTVMNAVMAMDRELDRSQTYQGNSKLDLTVSVPALGDAVSFSGSVSAVVLQNGRAAQGTVTYDLKELMGLIALLAADGEAVDDGAELDILADAMDDGMEMICDLDSGKLYLRGKLLAVATGQESADENTWYCMDLTEFMPEMGELTALSQDEISFGQLICMIALESGADPIDLKDTLDEIAETFAPVDDSHFTANGDVRHLEYALEDMGPGVIKLDVTMSGDQAAAIAGSAALDADGMKLDCTFSFSGMTASMRGSILAEGTVKIDFDLTADSAPAPADTVVATAPPAGATVVDLFELLLGSMIGEMEVPEDLLAA